jgi:hypothetical protein
MARFASGSPWFARIPTTPSPCHLLCVVAAPSSPSSASPLATIITTVLAAPPRDTVLEAHHCTTARAAAALWREAYERWRRRTWYAQPQARGLREGALSPGARREVAVNPNWPSPPLTNRLCIRLLSIHPRVPHLLLLLPLTLCPLPLQAKDMIFPSSDARSQ